MSRTVKPVGRQWSKPDGWHITKRLERKARPAGRNAVLAQVHEAGSRRAATTTDTSTSEPREAL